MNDQTPPDKTGLEERELWERFQKIQSENSPVKRPSEIRKAELMNGNDRPQSPEQSDLSKAIVIILVLISLFFSLSVILGSI